MPTKKKTAITAKNIILISSFFLISCKQQKEETTTWSAAMSRPSYYVTDGPHVFYYYKGKMISGTETLTDISDFGWGYPKAGRNNGKMTVFPDSVVVDYGGLNNKMQTCTYHGGMALPVEKIKALFRQGYTEGTGKKAFDNIITGMAPGGRITVWVDHVEIKRGKVEEKEVYVDYPAINFGDSIEINTYLKHFPVVYSIWDKPDPRYELDFGFCSEDGKSKLIGGDFLSKEGIYNTFGAYYTDDTKWGIPCNAKADYEGRFYQQPGEKYNPHKLQLPVTIGLAWSNTKKYDTRIVLPEDFVRRFTASYTNPKTGKKSHYHRIVVGIEKDGTHCIIWLDGPDKQEKLLRFKGEPMIENSEVTPFAREVSYY